VRRRRSIWRTSAQILIGYQALVAFAAAAFGAWIAFSAQACTADCGLASALFGVLGFGWLAQGLVASVAFATLFALTSTWSSRGVAIANIIVEALLIFPAITFLELMRRFGLPGPGLYALGVAIGGAFIIILLSGLDLFASDTWLSSRRLIAITS